LVLASYASFGLSLAFPAMVLTIILLLDVCVVLSTLLQPTHKTETGGTTNRKPAGPIIMMGQSEKLSSKWIKFITLFSASAQRCYAFYMLQQSAELCRAKTILSRS
jgi:hypothetical protein